MAKKYDLRNNILFGVAVQFTSSPFQGSQGPKVAGWLLGHRCSFCSE